MAQQQNCTVQFSDIVGSVSEKVSKRGGYQDGSTNHAQRLLGEKVAPTKFPRRASAPLAVTAAVITSEDA